MNPGIYYDLPFDEYLAIDAVNNSSLGPIQKSMAHYKAAIEEPSEPTEAMKLGSFLHGGVLEPLVALGRYVVMPPFHDQVRRPDGSRYDNPRNTKPYKELKAEFMAANADKTVVDSDWYESLRGITRAMRAHPDVCRYFRDGCISEVTLVWIDPATGLLCKCRLDVLNRKHRRIGEFKSIADASQFEWQIWRLNYHRQFAFYQDGLDVLTGERYEVFVVAAETTGPYYGLRASPVDPKTLDAGRAIYRDCLAKIAECRARNEWPGYTDPNGWRLPEAKMPSIVVMSAADMQKPPFMDMGDVTGTEELGHFV